MTTTTTVLWGIPLPVWIPVAAILGAALGGLLSGFSQLLGQMLIDRSNTKRLATQIAADRQVKGLQISAEAAATKNARQAELRKEVYLGTSTALHHAQTIVARYCNFELSESALFDEYNKRSHYIGQAHLIANERTASSLLRFTSAFSAITLQLSATRRQLEPVAQSYDATIASLRQVLQNAIQESAGPPTLDEDLAKRVTAALRQLAETEEKGRSLVDTRNSFCDACMSQNVKLNTLMIDCLADMREELEITFDREKYVSEQLAILEEY